MGRTRPDRWSLIGAWTSLALLVLWAALWAHSGVGSLAINWSLGGANEYYVRSDWGRVVFTRVHHPRGDDLPRVIGGSLINRGGYYGAGWGPPTGAGSLYGIVEFTRGNIGYGAAMSPLRFSSAEGATVGATYVRVTTYHPVLLPLILLPAAPWLRGALRGLAARRRRRSGMCGACGYDVRENPETCPECGTPVGPLSPPAHVAS